MLRANLIYGYRCCQVPSHSNIHIQLLAGTFEDDLQLIGQHFESADAGPVLGNQMHLVPRTAGELEEILTRVSRPVHSHQQRRRC